MNDVAVFYPLRVIMEILGVPAKDEAYLLKLTQESFGAGDPELSRDDQGSVSLAGRNVYVDFNNFFRPLHYDRQANPRDDVLSVIANGTINGKPVPEIEALSYYNTISTAGHDTTSSSSAAGVQALANDPELLARLKASPDLIPAFVDEAIRWATPVRHFMRTATEDTHIDGHPVAAGDWVMLCYPSANRDEAVFDDPFTFRIDRPKNPHLSFGFGGHVCLGQHLAKLELRILFEELLPRLKSVRLDGPVSLTESVFVGGIKSLPIAFELEP